MVLMNGNVHGTDGDLIALVDGERPSRHDVEAHVDSCAVCSARLAHLQQRSARLTEVLRAADPPVADRARLIAPPNRASGATTRRAPRGSTWSLSGWRAAAGILLVTGVAAASPARGWILDHVTGRRAERAPRERATTTPAPKTQPLAQPGGALVRFPSESDSLSIRFDVRPAAGSLLIVSGTGDRSSAQVVGTPRGEAFLVLPQELRIRNRAGSTADYEIVLSPAIRRVRVHMGNGGDRQIALLDVLPGTRHTIHLGAAGGGR